MKKTDWKKPLVMAVALLAGRLAAQDISLIMPFNSDTIENKNPFLNWSDLAGGAQGGRYQFELLVTEVQAGQTPEEATQLNPPIYQVSGLDQNGILYPSGAPMLQENVWYAWVVYKMQSGARVASSESWKFILSSQQKETPEHRYVRMKTTADGIPYQAEQGKVYFTFSEAYQPGQLQFELIDDADNKSYPTIYLQDEADERSGEMNVKYRGNNYYELDLGASTSSNHYLLRARDTKGRVHVLQIKAN